MRLRSLTSAAATAAALAVPGVPALAADWSDTFVGYRVGSKFAEPFGRNDIEKNIVTLGHASGYKYGSNFFNADVLMSDSRDPGGRGSTNGAHEVYVLYRHTLDIEKTFGVPMKFGPVRGVGITAGFDLNAKTDAGYNSKKRMLVLGPTLSLDVPGFLNVGVYLLDESNAPYNTFTGVSTPRYSYDLHPMLGAAWGIPVPVPFVPLSFNGYLNWIAPKGKNEFGVGTATETNIDMQLMADVGAMLGGSKNTFKLGLAYQYWRNKFGNRTTAAGAGAGPGATAKTPMIRAEYHF